MLDKNISLVLCSCDSYSDTWYPFLSQLAKNWPEFSNPIYLVTETKTINYDGLDVRRPYEYNGKKRISWSKLLKKSLQNIDTEYIVFSLDDFWITERVKHDEFEKIYSYMQSNKRMGFVCLKYEDKLFAKEQVEKNSMPCEYPELIECKPHMPYRITTQIGLWRKDYLIKLLKDFESAWYFEPRATWRSRFHRERVFDVKDSIFIYPKGGVLTTGLLYKQYVDLFEPEIIKHCSHRGFYDEAKKKYYHTADRGIKYFINKMRSAIPSFWL